MTARDRPVSTVLVILLALTGAACGRDTRVEIVAAFEPGVPLEGLEIVALPYDPRRLLDSLADLSPIPRPDFSTLEAELLAFQRPAYAEADAQTEAWAAVRDSVRRLSDSLRGVDRSSAGYRAAYDRFRHLYERFLQRTAARDASDRELTAEVRDLALRAGRAADSLRAWEQTAYALADSAAQLAQEGSGRVPVLAAVDSTGRASMRLAAGDWWLRALVAHPENPFVEFAWNVPIAAAGFPFRAALSQQNAILAWRH